MKVGFIGLGLMGAPMARRIKEGGYDLQVYNRSRGRTEPFAAEGIPVYDDPAELARNVDVVVIMVTGPDALRELIDKIVTGLRPESVVINMSTVSLDATRSAAARVQATGAKFVDAPVSGTVKPAQEGTLAVFAAGNPSDIDRVEPILSRMGRTILRCGAVGQGTAMKLAINSLLGGMMEAFAESLVLGERLGIDRGLVLQAVASGALNAPMFTAKGNMIASDDYTTAFSIDLLLKDLTLAVEEANRQGLSLPVTEAARMAVEATSKAGYGSDDIAAVYRYRKERV